MTTRWDNHWMEQAKLTSTMSRCPSRQLGAVIVRDDKFQVSSGFNGPPMGFPNPSTPEWGNLIQKKYGPRTKVINESARVIVPWKDWINLCPRKLLGVESGTQLHLCPCSHAERNAISIAARLGHSIEGCTIYVSAEIGICRDCAIDIVNAGITKVVTTHLNPYGESEGFNGQDILDNCDIGYTILGD